MPSSNLEIIFLEKLEKNNIIIKSSNRFNQQNFSVSHGFDIGQGSCFAHRAFLISKILTKRPIILEEPNILLDYLNFHEIIVDKNTLPNAQIINNVQKEYLNFFKKNSKKVTLEKFTHTSTSYEQFFFLEALEKMNLDEFEKLNAIIFQKNDLLQIFSISLYSYLFDPTASKYLEGKGQGHAVLIVAHKKSNSIYLFDPNMGIFGLHRSDMLGVLKILNRLYASEVFQKKPKSDINPYSIYGMTISKQTPLYTHQFYNEYQNDSDNNLSFFTQLHQVGTNTYIPIDDEKMDNLKDDAITEESEERCFIM